jgi:hypothetical protein
MNKFLNCVRDAGSVFSSSRNDFTRHNKKVWKRRREAAAGPAILIEFSRWNPLIGFSYLANVLADEFHSNIRPFVASPKKRKFLKRSFWIGLVRVGYFLSFLPAAKIYKSFGAGQVILVPRKSAKITLEARRLSDTFFGGGPTKRDLETFEIQNIPIGDLIYDTFLQQENLPTLDIADPRLRIFFQESVEDFLYWLDYVSSERVAAVISSHGVYNLAFPLRVAIAKSIPCFVAGSETIHRISAERPHPFQEFLDYPEFFDALSPSKKVELLDAADEVLRDRFDGFVGKFSDISEAGARLYGRRDSRRVLSQTSNTKVVVALHAFTDSPHAGGGGLFPDFWEWTRYLAEWSAQSPYEWYLKNHPDAPGDRPFVDALVKKFPHLTVLPDELSHHQLIEEGASAVLTIHGTIGFEYALQGVPVINASRINPHIRYPFNHHPQTIEELEDLLLRLHEIPKPTKHDRELARQYFAVKNHFLRKRFLIAHLGADRPPLGPNGAHANTKILRSQFVRSFEESRHIDHVQKIITFVKSGDYLLS